MRDIEADYKAAYLADYEAYARDGRTEDAARVAQILKDRFGYDVDQEQGEGQEQGDGGQEPAVPETTAAARPPEAAVEPKPPAKKTTPRKAPAKKTAASGKD
ncbi:hypothetical protein [Streptomyces tendae]|uniref:hypothetical protein n=1 Tax=Streptomyces tendae TaxID=1932 RepID=UPI003EBAFB4D